MPKQEEPASGGTKLVLTPEATPPKSGLCGHLNNHYFVGSNESKRRVPVLCEKPWGHEGVEHFSTKDVEGNPVINGFWRDSAGA